MSTELEGSQTTVRASGRVRKRPETFYDSSMQDGNKRKRTGARDSMQDDREIEEDSDDEEEAELDGDFHAVQPSREKRASTGRPVQKRAKTNTTATLAMRPAATKKRAPKGLAVLNGVDADAAGGLFSEVFAEAKDPQEIVSHWLQRFNEHESRALAEIINFVLRASGCASSVTEQDIEDPDAVTDRVADLQEEFQASNPTEYPLMKGRTARAIKHGINSFLDTLLKSIASNGVLYENPALIENIASWFTSMSSAANRPFRHTATIVALMIMKSFCELAKDAASDSAKITRQAETEKKKAVKNKARVADIQKKAQEARERQEYVEALLKDWYDTVFLHRYRDIDAAIRRECASALGDWILILPSIHLDGEHLRYLGWMLSDIHVSVRLEAVKQLIRFYKVTDLIGGLKAFTERFRSRLVEMATSDADTSVRTASIELLDQMRENGLLEPDDIDAIGRMVFELDEKVRKAAASFLSEGVKELYDVKIDELGGLEALEEVLPEVTSDDYQSPRLSWLKLKCVAETLQAYHSDESLPKSIERPRVRGELLIHAGNGESRFSLAADDMYDHIPEMSEWSVMAGLLLFDKTTTKSRRKKSTDSALVQLRAECELSQKEEMIMLEMLNVSARQVIAAYAENLVSRTLTKKQKLDLQDEVEEMATRLLSILPKLLEKYGEAPETAALVLHLLQTLDLDVFKDIGRDSATYTSLLEKVKRQFMSHTNDGVLESATKTMLQAASHTELDDVAQEKLTTLWEELVINFVRVLKLKNLEKRGTASEDVLTGLHNILHRIVRLATISDPAKVLEDESEIASLKVDKDIKAPIDCVLALMNRAKPVPGNLNPGISSLEDQIATRAAEIVLFYFQWRLASIKRRVEGPNGADIPFDELEALATRRDAYSDNLSAVLQARKAKDEICASFAGIMLDLHASSASLENIERNPTVSDDYVVFMVELDRAKQKEILQAFTGAETAYAALSGKRLEDASADASEGADEVEDVNADPVSDDEDDVVERESQTQMSQQKKEDRMISTLLAEQRLCQLTSKIVYAVLAGLMDSRSIRQRIERNKAKLGANFKAVCDYFDMGKAKAKKSAAKRAELTNGASAKPSKSAKSNAIVAESEDEDEIEDDEDPEALLKRGLIGVDDVVTADGVEGMEE